MMKRKASLMSFAVATVFGVPLTAGAQGTTLHQYPQASGSTSQVAPEDARFPGPAGDRQPARQRQQVQQGQAQQAQPEFMVITIEPIAPRMSYRQRAEATFRGLDTDGDGEISMSEAGVNTQLLNSFQKLDRNSDGTIDRREFRQVHVNDGKASSQAQASSSAQSAPEQSSAASGGTASAPRAGVPSPRIDERAVGMQSDRPAQPVR